MAAVVFPLPGPVFTIMRPRRSSDMSSKMRELSIVRENLAPKEKRPAGPLLFCSANCECGLDAFDVLRLPALGAFHYVELNLLTFLQAAKTIRLDGGEVNE